MAPLCNRCSEPSAVTDRGEYWCQCCYDQSGVCVVCDTRYDWDDLCPNSDDTEQCEDCGYVFYSHHGGFDHHDCESDNSEDYGGGGNLELNDYSYRPNPKFTGSGPLYVGVEIETAVRSWDEAQGLVDRLTSKRTRFYAKSDSTVPGFELVSHPFDPREFLNGDFSDLLPLRLLDRGIADGIIYRTHASTGLHIHMSKSAFTKSHLMRFLMVHHHMRTLCGLVGGRGCNSSWGHFDSAERVRDRVAKVKLAGGARYSAVNCTNEETIELRYPVGDSSSLGVKTVVEWALALYEYTRIFRASDSKLGVFRDPNRLVNWLRFRRDEYPIVNSLLDAYVQDGLHIPDEALTIDDEKEPMPPLRRANSPIGYCACGDCSFARRNERN